MCGITSTAFATFTGFLGGGGGEFFPNYKRSEIYITPLEERLDKEGHARKSVVGRWLVERTGEFLNDLYESKYGSKEN